MTKENITLLLITTSDLQLIVEHHGNGSSLLQVNELCSREEHSQRDDQLGVGSVCVVPQSLQHDSLRGQPHLCT